MSNEAMRQALEALEQVQDAGGGEKAECGWSITKLNRARPNVRAAIPALQEALAKGEGSHLTELVVAAREAWEEHGQSGDALDKALEPFSALVPYSNEPTCAEFAPVPTPPGEQK